MTGTGRTFDRRFRQLVALVAAFGILARLLAPMPAFAGSHTVLIAQLGAVGAVLCHTGGGADDPGPADTSSCAHCALCTASGTPPLLPSAAVHTLPHPMLAQACLPAPISLAACLPPSPEPAHRPRAPPAV